MSKLVLGIGTSHSPLLTMSPAAWSERAKDDLRSTSLNLSDGRFVSYAQLLQEVGERHAEHATAANFTKQYDQTQRALDRQAAAIKQSALDVLVIIGDDQGELFDRASMPALALYHGEEVVMHPWSAADYARSAWLRDAAAGYGMDAVHRYAGAPAYALGIIERLIDSGVDLAACSEVGDPHVKGFGHAYGFVAERLLDGARIPLVPVLLNTYFPPNVPTAARCHAVGQMLGDIIVGMPDELRVGVAASGGLSHFVTDEVLDRTVLEAIRNRDADTLRAVPRAALSSGSSEILNWIMAAGALEHLSAGWIEYVPVHRTPAGTGIGLAFAIWTPVS